MVANTRTDFQHPLSGEIKSKRGQMLLASLVVPQVVFGVKGFDWLGAEAK